LKKHLPLLAILFLLTATSANAQNFSSEGFYLSNDPYMIEAATMQPDGKFLVSGSFHRFGNKSVSNLVRIKPNGELDTTFRNSGGTDGTITHISAHPDGSIVLAGNFTRYDKNGVTAPLIRIFNHGAIDASFQSVNSQLNMHGISAVQALSGGKVLVAGRGILPESSADLSTVVRLNKNGTIDRSFQSSFSDEYISGIALQSDSSIIVYGSFQHWGNTAATGIVRISRDGFVDPQFTMVGTGLTTINQNSFHIYRAVPLPGSKLLVTGTFERYNNMPVQRTVKLNADGSMDQTFQVDPSIYVNWTDNVEQLSDGTFVLSGNIWVNDAYRWLVKLTANGQLFSSNSYAGPEAGLTTYGVKRIFALDGGEFYCAGAFSGKVNGVGIGVFNKFNAGAQPYSDKLYPFRRKGGVARTAVDSAHRIVVVGNFDQYGDVTSQNNNYIARLLPDGKIDTAFHSSGSNGYTHAVDIQQDGGIVVAGAFTELNGVAANGIGRLKDDGFTDITFNPGAGPDDRNMYDVHVAPDQHIYVTGSFRNFDNSPHAGVARLRADGSVDHLFTTDGNIIHGPQSLVTLADGTVIYGESSMQTTMYFDKPMRIYKVNTQGASEAGFTPPVIDYPVTKKIRVGAEGAIYWLGTIYHDNNATTVDQPIIKLNANGTVDTAAYSRFPRNLFVKDFEILPNGKLAIACERLGTYDSADVVMRLNADLTIDSTFVPVALLYNLQHVNHDGDDKIIIAGEPKRAFRFENEQIQNIAIITKNGMELHAGAEMYKNLMDTAVIKTSTVGSTIERQFTIVNESKSTLELLSPNTGEINGEHKSEFSITTNDNVRSIAPGDSVRFTVKFAPKTAGNKTVQLRIPYTDGLQQVYAIQLAAAALVNPGDTVPAGGTVLSRVYPNPVQGNSLTITSAKDLDAYEIVDLSGRVLQSGKLQGTGTYSIQLNGQIRGIFLMKLRSGKEKFAKKLMRF
jgi:uncharacterized delta-60 repeat protein